MLFLRQGATHKVVIGPAVAVGDGFTPVTTLSLSTADEAEAILHDNGTVVDISSYTFGAVAVADGYYHLTLQSGISGTVGHLSIVINDDSLCLPVKADFTIVEEAVYDQLYAASAPGAATVAALSAVDDLVDDLESRLGTPSDLGGGATIAANLADIEAQTDDIGVAGAGLTNINLPNQTMDITGNITGNLSGSVGSVTGLTEAGIVDAVWDEDATGHQTTGTFGQAIGDPVADTNTIFKAVVTDATGATVGADVVAVKTAVDTIDNLVDDLESRLGTPSDLGGGATVAANLADIEAQTDDIGAAGAGLTALATQASVNTIDGIVDDILLDTAEIGVAGAGLTNINLPNQTMDITGDITGNLSGSVGSVSGAVGSVTGAVGSVTAPVSVAAGQFFVKKNTELANFEFVMFDSTDHITPKTGLTVAVQASKDGAAFANVTNTPATEVSAGVYKITLSTTDLNVTTVMLKATATDADNRYFFIVTQA